MWRKRLIGCLLVACSSLSLWANGTLRIVSYNVENLFDYRHDTLKQDLEFTPEGDRHWTYRRYQAKVERIAQVLVSIGGWQESLMPGADPSAVPALVGLCEVENDRCLRSLCWQLRRYHYRYIHYKSPDARGIDVALLYDSTRVRILRSEPLHIDLQSDATRDILYAEGVVLSSDTSHPADTLHLFVCHLPSQYGGAAATAWKRQAAKQVLQSHIDSLLTARPQARIVVMGDMNTEPLNDLTGMTNLMYHTALPPLHPKSTAPPSAAHRDHAETISGEHQDHATPTSEEHQEHIEPTSGEHRGHATPTSTAHQNNADPISGQHRDHADPTSGEHQDHPNPTPNETQDRDAHNTSVHGIEVISSYFPKQTSPHYIAGTHKYNGLWSYLDQFYISESLLDSVSVSVFAPDWLLEEDAKYLGIKPKRTFVGYRYQDAYSDHLPIVLQITL